MSRESDVKIIKADTSLKEKIGVGEIAKTRIEASQKVIENNDVDFEPMAISYLEQLNAAIQALHKSDDTTDIHAMVKPVMELKANAEMFGYPLVTELTNVMLSFLEGVEKADQDVIQIVDAHRKTLLLIIKQKMSGDVGDKGAILVQELKGACARYYAKKK